MSLKSLPTSVVEIQPLTVENFRPLGWVLGKAIPLDESVPAFRSADIDFWHEHCFDPGGGGETEILWINHRNANREVSSLEVHRLTQQVIVPLTGKLIQVVACSGPDGSPDTSTVSAFGLPVGEGICMRAGCWHATRVDSQDVKCLMLTRRSTTTDLIAYLSGGLVGESAVGGLDGKFLLANRPLEISL